MLILFKAKFWMLKNWFARMTYGDAVKTLGFGLLGAFFLLLLYAGFLRMLWEVRQVQLLGGLLVLKLMAMTFLTMFLMIIFSSTLASFTTLFFARDLSFLMHSPLSFRSVFVFKSVETVVFSSWMTVLALLPFLLAYGQIYQLGLAFYAGLAVLAVPFAAIAGILGIGLSLTLMCVFPSRRVREVMLLLAMVTGCSLYVLLRLLEPEKLVRADSFEVVFQYLALMEAPVAPYLPSWWVSSAITAYVAGRPHDVLAYGSLLFGTAVILGSALVLFAEKAYHAGWTSAQEGSRRRGSTPLGAEWRFVPPFFGTTLRALLGKDARLFARDANQWAQFLLLLSLVAVYLISIAKLPLDTPYLKGLVSFLNIGMAGFVLAAVALRVVFPSVSLEGRSWWALRSAPMGLWTILWEKFLIGFLPLCSMGIILIGTSNRFLQVDPFVMWMSNVTIFFMALSLSGMGVGFGALFPRFHVENIAQIETSPGGVLYMVCALFYVGLTLVLEAVLMRMHYFSSLSLQDVWHGGAVPLIILCLVVVNAAAFGMPFVFGKLQLEKMDV
jgi:ABC-2 type transport system permease protein